MLKKLTSLFRPEKPVARCIGTYHKAGTVWLNGIFQEVAQNLQMPFVEVETDTKDDLSALGNYIAFNHSSRFPSSLFSAPVHGVRIIRDPRDMVISGAHYHGRGTEDWLNTKQDVFDGKSYCEAINALDTMQEKYSFEMRQTASYVIRQMVHADHNEPLHLFVDKNFRTFRYEDLINDVELVEVQKVCEQLRLPFEEVGPVFVKGSLFGQQKIDGKHIRSGKTQQWKTEFTKETAEDFASLHQEALEILGYETDRSWVKQL